VTDSNSLGDPAGPGSSY